MRVAVPKTNTCRLCGSSTARRSRRCRPCFRAEQRLGPTFLALVLAFRIDELGHGAAS
jgi:hypothetical protein